MSADNVFWGMVNNNLTNDGTSGETGSGSGLLEAVDKAILAIQVKLNDVDGPAKVSLTDLTKLLQLREELEGERPRRINVRWVDSPGRWNDRQVD